MARTMVDAKARGSYIGSKRRRLISALALVLVTAIGIGITCRWVRQAEMDHALVTAVEHNDAIAVSRLLGNGADPNVYLVYQNNPHTLVEVLKWMIRSREIIWHEAPVLNEAADSGNLEIVKSLLDSGAGINATDQNGWTALMEATLRGRSDIVQLLLKRGASATVTGGHGVTALKIATNNDHTEIVEMLKGAGATR